MLGSPQCGSIRIELGELFTRRVLEDPDGFLNIRLRDREPKLRASAVEVGPRGADESRGNSLRLEQLPVRFEGLEAALLDHVGEVFLGRDALLAGFVIRQAVLGFSHGS